LDVGQFDSAPSSSPKPNKMIVRDGFVWLIVTNKAKEVFASGLFEIFALHDDGSESLCLTYDDINEALESDLDLAIEVGHYNPNQISVDICYYQDDNGNKVYDYEGMHSAFELSMSNLDPKQYSETSR